jgi:hypothetical protein
MRPAARATDVATFHSLQLDEVQSGAKVKTIGEAGFKTIDPNVFGSRRFAVCDRD